MIEIPILQNAPATIIVSINNIVRYFIILKYKSLQQAYSSSTTKLFSSIVTSDMALSISKLISFSSFSLTWITCLFLTLVLSTIFIDTGVNGFKILEVREGILHNEDKIGDIMRHLHRSKRMKVKAVLPGHRYLIQTFHDSNITAKEYKFVDTRELEPYERYKYVHPHSKHCKVLTGTPDALIHYIAKLSRNKVEVDKEYIDDYMVSLRFKDVKERDKYTSQIFDYGGVLFMECKAPYRHHDYHAHSIMAGVNMKDLSSESLIKYGKGNIVTVVDTGLDTTHCLFHDPESKVPYFKWSRHNKIKASDHFSNFNHKKLKGYISLTFANTSRNTDLSDSSHGHGTHTAGTVSFSGLSSDCGVHNDYPYLPEHKILFVDIQNNNGNTDEGSLELPSSLERLLDTIKEVGSNTISCSFGSPNSTHYSFESYMVDKWIYENQDSSIVVSAGNDGPGSPTVGSFGDAKNVITIGASSNSYDSFMEYMDMKVSNLSFEIDHIRTHPERYSRECMTDFSSRGTFDGRIKPDVVAPGSFVLSGDAYYGSKNYHKEKILYRGTSMSAPMVANFVSLVRHIIRTRDNIEIAPNALVKSLLVTFAKKMHGCQQITKVNKERKILFYDREMRDLTYHDYGHGLVVLKDFLHGLYGFRRGILSTFSVPFRICLKAHLPFDDSHPFKASMVYDDPPSLPGLKNGTLLVNDLNLRMIIMDEKWKFKQALSPNHLEFPSIDEKNNVESIEASLDHGDIVRIEVAPDGIISGYPFSTSQEFAVSWNSNMEEVECPTECHPAGFDVQCIHEDEITYRTCTNGTYNSTCANDEFNNIFRRMEEFKKEERKEDIIPSVKDEEKEEIDNGYLFMGIVYGFAFIFLVFVVVIVQ